MRSAERSIASIRPAVPVRGLSRTEAASVVGVSATTFDRLVEDGLMPPARKIYGRLVWDVIEINQAFDALPHSGATPTDTGAAGGW